jgi:uncharacterized repeat protein (TIGR01451 family)
MPDYNPNSVWGSKEKEYVYTPPGTKPTTEGNAPPDRTGGSLGTPSEPTQPSFFRRHGLFFFTIGIFLLIALAGFVYYLVQPPSTPNVVITFSDPGTVVVGQPFPLTITVANESKSVLQNATLNVSLPNGLSFVGEDPTQRVMPITVGTLSSQTINPPLTPIQVIATENPGASQIGGTSQTIGAQLTYQTAATAATQFQNNATASIAVGAQSALSLSYNAPSGIFSGQNFDIDVNYQNNTASALQGVQLTMQYPPAYHFVSSSPTAPTGAASNMWNLGTIAPNATGTLVITGNIVGPTQAQYPLTGTIGATFSGQNYPASAAPVSFVVTPSPLSLTIALNNSSAYVAGLGDNLNYVLTYTNNAKVTFQSVNISAVLVGSMFNFSSLKTSGSFNSQSNTITWYAANTPALASLAPGQSGTVDLTINTKTAFPIKLPSDKNYSLSVTAKAQSPTVPPNTAGLNTTSVTALTNKVGGEIALTSDGFYKETTPGITNTGPYPPKVDQPTTYTIHWKIVNYSTDAQNVTVSAYLQSGSTFTGVATSTGLASTSLPTYNAGTGQITWTIPFIPATAGVISAPVQTVFQVTNTPAVNQVGQTVTLLGPATLTATDAYTSSTVTTATTAVTSELPDDPSINATGQTGAVTQ